MHSAPENSNVIEFKSIAANKIPPHNADVEIQVLGGIMFDEYAMSRVDDILRPEMFYTTAHSHIYQSMAALFAASSPVNMMTISNYLADHSLLELVGGRNKLAEIADPTVSAVNVDFLATVVRDKWIRRQLIRAGNAITELGYDTSHDLPDVLEQAEEKLFAVGSDSKAMQYSAQLPSEALIKIWNRLETGGQPPSRKTGLYDIDSMTGGLRERSLNIVAARSAIGKTQLAVFLSYEIAIKQNLPVVFFSAEMSHEELMCRFLALDSGIDSHKLLNNGIKDSDWSIISASVAKFGESPLLINDNPNPTIAHMRSQVQKVKTQYGSVGLVVLDYLQMLGGTNDGYLNRVQELDTITKGCKTIAKDFDVPFVALAQINRGVENRADKRPMMSDIKDCLSGDSLVVNAITGKWTPIKDIQVGDRVLSIGKNQKIVSAAVTNVWNKGEKEVFGIRTKTGKTIKATSDHLFLTAQGYVPLKELAKGSVIATAMRLPEHGQENCETSDLCRLLGYLAGDGGYSRTSGCISFISADSVIFDDFSSIVAKYFPEVGISYKRSSKYYEADFSRVYENGWGKPGGNPFKQWLRSLGILGQNCATKRVPSFVFESGVIGAKEFLSGYLATDGCVKINLSRKSARTHINFDTVSFGLAQDVQKLLLRINVVSTVGSPAWKELSTRPIYRISLSEVASNMHNFIDLVDCRGKKGQLLQDCLAFLAKTETNNGLLALPSELAVLMNRLDPKWRNQGKRPQRSGAARIAQATNSESLLDWAESDLLWEPILSIEPSGIEETWDIEVPETRNFLADGIVVHNCGGIEQAADVIFLLYREDYYQPDTPDRGIIEIAVGKNRNGSTGTTKFLFDPTLSKFLNLVR